MVDRFAIIEGHFWYCIDFHSGQSSRLYARYCKISKYFKPGLMDMGPSSHEAMYVYNELVRKNHPEVYARGQEIFKTVLKREMN